MASGWSYNGVCFAVQQDAINAYYSAIPPDFLQTATTAYKLHYLYVGSSWQLQKQTISSAGALTTNYTIAVPTNVNGICTVTDDPYTQFLDGTVLGWGVATAMIISYLLSKVIRGRG